MSSSISVINGSTDDLAIREESPFSMNSGNSNSGNSDDHIDSGSNKSGESFESEEIINEAFSIVPYNIKDKKPRLGLLFSTLADAIDFYTKYGEEIGFDVNLSSQKRYNDGTVRIRYLKCSKAGFTETFKHDSINESESCKRKTTSKRIGCPAIIKFKNLPDIL
ncbi:hypothetical protein L1887_24115 [Cichorium endivia]|nr:hypothetical protein L1887_24115 [Cichorium endivia]